jgi:hypothetical protein
MLKWFERLSIVVAVAALGYGTYELARPVDDGPGLVVPGEIVIVDAEAGAELTRVICMENRSGHAVRVVGLGTC